LSQAGLSQQLALVKQGLYDLGYHEPHGATIQDYRFITSEKQLGHADLLAFGDTQLCDISTSCIAVNALNNNDDQFSALKNNTFVGAPIALFVLPEHVEIWPVSTNFSNALQQQKKLSYEDLPEYLHTRGRELAPRSLLSAKKGARQLSLFDLDPSLIEFARDATQEILVRQFEVAIQATSVDIRKKYSKQLHRLAIWVLAARILQDKLHDYADLRTNDALALLRAVQQRFPNYFTTLSQDLSVTGEEVAYQLYDGLSGDFTFRSLTNDMLAYFYENTLVDGDIRKEFGIYYTPRSLAQRIFSHLPIEDFPPEDRTILDGTCGSGNLLLAGYNRLADLLPSNWSSVLRHTYLLNHIWGIDQDSYACEIARLSLLLYNLPAGDSWQVKTADVFQANPQCAGTIEVTIDEQGITIELDLVRHAAVIQAFDNARCKVISE